MGRCRAAVVVGALAIAACGDDGSVVEDGAVAPDSAVDAGSVVVPAAPEAPAAPMDPALPVLTPCPDGWREASRPDLEGVVVCDPWPTTGRADCPVHEIHLPGRPGCERVGTTCAADGWPGGLPADGSVVFVRAGVSPTGVGTRANPFATIAEGLAAVPPAGTVAVAVGRYDEPVAPPAGITVLGACVEGTTVSTTDRMEPATISVTEADVRVENLHVSGNRFGVSVSPRGAVSLVGVVVSGASSLSMGVVGGRVDGTDVVLRDSAAGVLGRGLGLNAASGADVTLSRAAIVSVAEEGALVQGPATAVRLSDSVITNVAVDAGGLFGKGIDLIGDAQVVLERVEISDTHDSGLQCVMADANFDATDTIIRRVMQDGDGEFGVGVNYSDGGAASFTRVLIEDVHEAGLFADRDSTLAFEDLVIADVVQSTRPFAPRALGVGSGSMATGRRALLARATDVGIVVADNAASLTTTDLTVIDIRPDIGAGSIGVGLNAHSTGRVDFERARFERTRRVALLVLHPETTIALTDLTVRGTLPGPLGLGRGLEASAKAVVDVTRALFEGNTETGVIAGGLDTTLRMQDVAIRDTLARPMGRRGRGIEIQSGAEAELLRVEVERARDVAFLIASERTTVDATDLVVRDTESNEGVGDLGRAINVQHEATFTGTRLLLERNRDVSMMVGFGAMATLSDFEIRDSLERPCARDTCPNAGNGTGLAAVNDGIVAGTAFAISDNVLAGLQIVRGEADLVDGVIARNTIGANVQAVDFDIDRIRTRVRYVDNGEALNTTDLPVPEAMVPES